jgi:hypothetical protein
MSIIRNIGPNASAGILAQQFAKRSSQQATNTQTSSPAPAISATAQPEKPNPYATLTSFLSKWKDAQQAIGSLSRAPQAISQARKAAAAEMIQRIKNQIKLLMMMGGGNPKARAQQIAQLARQLATAAQEYASASGGGSQEGNASAAGNTSAQNDTAASSGGEQNATASAASATPDAAEATSSATPDTSAAAAATAVASATSASPAESPISTQQVSEQVGSKVAEYSGNSSESNADQEFAMEVRRLAAQLKALAKQNEVRSPNNPEKSTDREMALTNDAFHEIERALSNIDSANTAVTVSIAVVAK